MLSLQDKANASRVLQAIIKDVSGTDPSGAVSEIEESLGVPVDPAIGKDSPFAMVNPEEIDAAVGGGLIEFGAHTVHHPLLSGLMSPALGKEIDESIARVEELTGRECRTFAYPNGRPQDFDARAIVRLEANSILAAVTSTEGPNLPGDDPLRLARWSVGADLADAAFQAKVLNLRGSALRAGIRRRSRRWQRSAPASGEPPDY